MRQLFRNTKEMLGDTAFLKKSLTIALPVAMQGMLNTIVNLVDTLMIGSLGETTIAAVGLANKVFFVYSLLVFGICSGSGILAAQYFGNKDLKNVRKVLGLALMLAMAASMLFVVPCLCAPKQVMRIFTGSEATIAVGAAYLMVVVLGYPFSAITNVYVALMRSVGKVKAPVVISCAAILINIVFNYIFIFGHFGAPALGAVGAALATLIARVVECILLMLSVYLGKTAIACRISELFGYDRAFVRQFVKTSGPVIANEFFWGLGTAMYSLAYGRMGDQAVAAITISATVEDIVRVWFQGLSAATAVILGQEMGAGKLKRAERYATNFFLLQFLVTLAAMGVCYGIRPWIIGLYDITDAVAFDVNRCILVFILYMPFTMFNFVNVVGVLRSGGDTKACFFVDTSGVWAIGVTMAFFGGLYLKLPVYLVYAMIMLEQIYKTIIGYARYRQKKWLRNLAKELNA